MSLELATTHKSQAAPDIPCCWINFSNYLHTSDSENNYFPSDTWASPVAQLLKNPPANAGDASDVGSIPGLGRYPGEGNGNPLQYPEGKESTCNVGGPGFDPWVGKIPWRRERLPTPVSFPGEFRRERSLRGYSPWCQHSWVTFTFTCWYEQVPSQAGQASAFHVGRQMMNCQPLLSFPLGNTHHFSVYLQIRFLRTYISNTVLFLLPQ